MNGNDIDEFFDDIGSSFEGAKFTFFEATFGNMTEETGDLMFANKMRLQLFELSKVNFRVKISDLIFEHNKDFL